MESWQRQIWHVQIRLESVSVIEREKKKQRQLSGGAVAACKRKGDIGFQNRMQKEVFSAYLDPRHTGVCSVLFWVICMVLLQLHLEDAYVSFRLMASKTKGRQGQVKLVKREDEEWKTGEA